MVHGFLIDSLVGVGHTKGDGAAPHRSHSHHPCQVAHTAMLRSTLAKDLEDSWRDPFHQERTL